MTMLNTEALTAARRYKIAREVAGLRQDELARMIGVSRTTIGDWEAGRTEPAASKLVMLSLATNQSLDWFAEGLILEGVRLKGLEPLTFWLVADQAERAAVDAAFWSIVACQVSPDSRRDDFERVA